MRTNLKDILHDVEQKALVSLDGAVDYSLQDKIVNGQLYVDQGIMQDVPAADLKISVQQQISSKDIISVPMSLHSVYILQVHRSTWNL